MANSSSSSILATYVTIEGTLSISTNAAGTTTYYNLSLPGSSNQGSISNPAPAIAEKLESGKTYSVTGYYVYVSGTSYFNVVATDVVEAGSSPSTPTPPTGDGSITSNIKNLKAGDNLTATAIVTAQASTGLVLTDNAG